MNRPNFFIFLFFIFSEFFLIHIYAYYIIVKRFNLSLTNQILLIFFFCISASILLTTRHLKGTPVFFIFAIYGFLWVGTISLTLFASFLEYLVFLALRGDLKKLLVIISVLFIIIAASLYTCQLPPIVTKIDVPIEFLPESLTGFSIVQLSDLHVDSRKSKEWLKRIVETTNGLNPDLIVITGDLLSRDRYAPDKFIEILSQLKSGNGIYAVTGNHDHCVGVSNFLEFCEDSNIKVLRNEHIIINNQIELIGIDYLEKENNSYSGSNLKDALLNCDLTKPLVLLSHAPNHFRKAVDLGIDLQLSGHTHAGQIPPIDLIYFLLYRYPYGLYRYKSSSIYTTCGLGTWGPPIRLSSRPEIVLIKLVDKEK